MNIQAEKIEIMKMVLETENPGILDSIKKLLKKESKTDFWETLQHDKKEEILLGIEEIENNETIDFDEFIKKHL
ncbi:MAG: hypothetical protein Q8S54_19000 [Bacteroidota bacterium]|nr:hypothetical protein [Bacteroidota bacterium]